ncbi:AraC family transcriptional regulator [Lutibacter citreus]|uniref:AraC family transcriptional regulator n=1 Tax=Lutibacter citreus TaxID=2138210 RepID=UPI000DBE9D1B|nr:AraC family transcriptional regulator [Lutibacter citreus]
MTDIFTKPLFEALPNKTGAFSTKRLVCTYLEYPYHYHPEYELTYIIKGKGKRFTGNNIEEFEANDFVLMGRNLPHVWKSDIEYYDNPNLLTDCIVIQFSKDSLGKDFFELNELKNIKDLLNNSKYGIKFSKKIKAKLLPKMKKIVSLSGAKKITSFIDILDECSKDKDIVLLSKKLIYINPGGKDSQRFSKIFNYIIENLHREITVNEVSTLVGLADNSFSRYFKKHTNESFVKFVNKLRIEASCSLIKSGEKNFTQICFEVGFGSLSYFNRQFKQYKKTTPSEYMRTFHNF